MADEPTFLQSLLSSYGYYAIVIGTFLEGETIVILAGIAAQQGLGGMNVWWIALAAFIGSLGGDQTWFLIGRRWGNRLLDRKPKWRERSKKVLDHVYRHKVPFILSFRFFYGLRNVTPFVLATTPIPMWQFSLLNAIGAAVWALSFAWGGFALGHAAETVLGYMKRGGLILIAMIGIAIVVTVWWRWRRARTRAAAAAHVASQPQAVPAVSDQSTPPPG